jgi:hypothetical protein
MALGIIFLYLGAACLYVAVHGTTINDGAGAKTPWEAFSGVLRKVKDA